MCEELLTQEEASNVLGVGRHYIIKIVKEGELKEVAVNSRCKMYRPEDIEEFITGKHSGEPHKSTVGKMTDKLLTQDDVAELLRLHKTTVIRLVKEGRLREIQLSHKCKRYKLDDVNAFIEGCAKQNKIHA